MHYAVELNGPDTFKVRVVRRGSITSISPSTAPLNQTVHLVLTGTKLDHAELEDTSNYNNANILAGATSTRAEVDLTFVANGTIHLLVFDSVLSQADMASSTAFKFLYNGSLDLSVVAGTGVFSGSTTVITSPLITSGTVAPAPFIDIAPKATMTNIFRRQFTTASFTENGVAYFQIGFQNACSGMSGNQSKIITIPNPIWGASNVGTANVTIGFQSQLRNGTAVLQTGDVAPLNAGATQNFTFTRASSSVRVFTFLTHLGCFVSPTADQFFEDPPFTVVVNTNGAVADTNTTNNTRNY
jgi:hypothetical protein